MSSAYIQSKSVKKSKWVMFFLISGIIFVLMILAVILMSYYFQKSLIIDSEELLKGKNLELGVGEKINFDLQENEMHSLTVDSISSNSVSISIESEKIILDLKIGVVKRIDVNGDGEEDIIIKLVRIKNKKLSFIIKKLNISENNQNESYEDIFVDDNNESFSFSDDSELTESDLDYEEYYFDDWFEGSYNLGNENQSCIQQGGIVCKIGVCNSSIVIIKSQNCCFGRCYNISKTCLELGGNRSLPNNCRGDKISTLDVGNDTCCIGRIFSEECAAGLKCFNNSISGWQNSSCNWLNLTYCEYGCDNRTGNCASQIKELVAYYSFEGNANDVSGKGNDGVVNGAQLVSGKIGQGYYFDGINDYINVPKKLIENNSRGTYSLWIYENPSSNFQIILAQSMGGVNNNFCYALTYATFNYITYFNSNSNIGTGNSYNYDLKNKWIHISASWNQSSSSLYINGILVSSGAGPFCAQAPSENFMIGEHPYLLSNSYFNGTIDEVKVWNYILNSSEILAEYQRGMEQEVMLTLKPGFLNFIINWFKDFDAQN